MLRSILRAGVAATMLAAPALGLGAAPAGAAYYNVWACAGPDNKPASIDGWSVRVHDGTRDKWANDCPTGKGLSITMLPGVEHSWDDYADLVFAAPPDTSITAYRLWRTVHNGPAASNYGYSLYERHGGDEIRYDKCLPGCVKIGDDANPLAGPSSLPRRLTDSANQLRVDLSCLQAGGAAPCPASTPAIDFTLHRLFLELTDNAAPVLTSPPSGPLAEGAGPFAGPQAITVSASDKGGGVRDAILEVDGREVVRSTLDDNGGRCREPFRTPVPCKLGASGTLTLDTTTLADGAHTLRVIVTDATGQNTAVWGPRAITTANASCNPQPLAAGPPALGAWLLPAGAATAKGGRPPRGAARATVAYGRGARLEGRVVDAAGAGVAGAALCIISTSTIPGAGPADEGRVTTRPDGRFALDLAPGPSREIAVVDRLPGGAVVQRVAVRTRAGVALAAARRRLRTGQLMVLNGRLRGGPIPVGGVLVGVQARRGRGWQTFADVRTDAAGRFSVRHRLTRTVGVQRYVLRARVRAQAAYPYTDGHSGAVTVKVNG